MNQYTEPRPAADRFWAKVDSSTGPLDCWRWLGTHSTQGYARFVLKDGGRWRGMQATRFVYELTRGKIPDGLFLDHLCRNRWCVNPAHLDPVTNRENALRGHYGLLTACKQGHPFTPENTGRLSGRRRCLTCHRLSERRRRAVLLADEPGYRERHNAYNRAWEARRHEHHLPAKVVVR